MGSQSVLIRCWPRIHGRRLWSNHMRRALLLIINEPTRLLGEVCLPSLWPQFESSFLLWWQWSKEQSSPAWQPFTARQSVSRTASSYWQATSLNPPPCLAPRPPPSPLHLALYNRFPSVFDCLSVCVSRLKSALLPDSILSLCYLFFMLLLSISVTSLMPNILLLPATLSQRHPLSPSSLHLLHVYLSSVDCAGVTASLPLPPPPLQQQTLFTLLLNKPKGEHDPRWHALASSQHIPNKQRRKEEKDTRDKNHCFCLQAVCPLVQRKSESEGSD